MDSNIKLLLDTVLNNFYQMLSDRNYTKLYSKNIILKNVEYEDFYIVYEDKKKKKNILCLMLFKNDTKNKKKKILDHVFELSPKYDKYIILHFSKKIKIVNVEADIEYFSYMDFITNITKHDLQPKFKKIDKVDNIDITKLPKIMESDPICRYYNFLTNDIIMIDDDGIYSLRLVIKG